jgi:SAM-dependent methyltransferase
MSMPGAAVRPAPELSAFAPTAHVDLATVREFWSANPLYSGESRFAPGTPEFFDAHERMTVEEHSDEIHPIFLRDVVAGTKVLDVGCGIGFWVHQFARRGGRVTACDLTETAVGLTRRRADLYGFAVDARIGNAEALPFEPESFDHVNCQGVIHHTPDTARCLEEFHRVLRPGGTLSVSVYYRSAVLRSRLLFRLVTAIARGIMRLPGRGRESMLWAKTPEELVRMYDGAGNPLGKAFTRAEMRAALARWFVVTEELRLGFPRRALRVPLPTSAHRLLGRVLGLMIVFRCQKPLAGAPVLPVQRAPAARNHTETR